MGPRPVLQYVPRTGIIDLAWGHPDPSLLPVEGLRQAADRVFQRFGADALAYGYAAGPGPLIDFVVERLTEVDARAPQPECVLITGGNSQALDQVATLLASPGDRVLVESPTYHLAVRILRDHPLELVPIPSDADGLRVDVLATTLTALRRSGRPARLLYCIPTFNNPTGVSLATARRRALVELAAEEHVVVIEDDTYRELSYDGPAPASLWSLARAGVVVRLGTFSKSLAPGLRCGFLTADAAIVDRFRTSGLLDSGGAVSHFTSLVVVEYARAGAYGPNVERLRNAYRERRDALLAALGADLGGAATWRTPAGGYFVWVSLAGGFDADALLPSAEAGGTSFMSGPSFYVGPVPAQGRGALRLAFTLYGPAALVEAARRLARAVTSAA
jgi:2-aminoadipate transaminase